MDEIKKLKKQLEKQEKKYENAGPVERKRIEKKTLVIGKRLKKLTGEDYV